MNDAALREVFVLWGAWGFLVDYVKTNSDARTVDPHDVFGAACAVDRDRLAALLYGHQQGATLDESADILDELLEMARDGRRPRFGREVGLLPEMFRPDGGPA